MSENPPTGPRYGDGPDPDPSGQPQTPPPAGGYPPPGNYPPPGGTPPPGNYPPQGGSYPPPPGNYPPQGGSYPPPPGNYPPQGGGYPPPPGNYPPQGGGYPPPPGNYGAAGYGGAGFGAGLPPTLSVGDAISFGWNKFKDNAGVWVGIVLIAAVIQIVINLIFGGFGGSTSDLSETFSLWRILGT
ncbi:MAG: hypothetical protein WBA81_08320, partial [Rhodococcus sp. (in: high G+C Gram-positive bacteria)]